MRDRIFKEMCDAKLRHIYSEMSLDYYRKISNAFTAIVTIFSAGGVVMGLSFWKTGTVWPLISCVIITAIQALKLVAPTYVPSANQLKKIEKVIDFYVKYYTDLEKVWYDYDNDRIDDKAAHDKFFKIKATEAPIIKISNETIKHKRRKISKEAQLEALSYLKIFQ